MHCMIFHQNKMLYNYARDSHYALSLTRPVSYFHNNIYAFKIYKFVTTVYEYNYYNFG
jgi:hypothetical protein